MSLANNNENHDTSEILSPFQISSLVHLEMLDYFEMLNRLITKM